MTGGGGLPGGAAALRLRGLWGSGGETCGERNLTGGH